MPGPAAREIARLYWRAVPSSAGIKPVPDSSKMADSEAAVHVARDIAAINSRLESLRLTSSYLSGQNILGMPNSFFQPFYSMLFSTGVIRGQFKLSNYRYAMKTIST